MLLLVSSFLVGLLLRFTLALHLLGTKASAYQRRRYEPKTFDLLSTREAYNESVFHRCDEEAIKRAHYRLRKQAAQLGFQVIPLQNG